MWGLKCLKRCVLLLATWPFGWLDVSSQPVISTDNIEIALDNIESLETFSLYAKNIDTVDTRISLLVNLKELILASNNLHSVPDELYELDKLEQLHLYKNNLTQLGNNISKLTNLEILLLSDNNLKSIPDEISELGALVYLDLSNNPLTKKGIRDIKRALPNCTIKF